MELCPGDLDVEAVSAEQDTASAEEAAKLLSALSDEEYRLLEAYYDSEHGSKAAVAKEYGMTMAQLYKRVQTLRLRLLRRQPAVDEAEKQQSDCTNRQKFKRGR
jgi:DNA-binding NtrC family response regulator